MLIEESSKVTLIIKCCICKSVNICLSLVYERLIRHLLRAQSEIFREVCIKIYLLKRHLILYNFIEERIWCYIKIKLSNRQACVSFSYSYILIVFN